MKDRPTDLDVSVLASALGAWGFEPVTLTHAPVGFGDHHWVAVGTEGRRTFVTVSDLAHKPHCGPDAATAWTGLNRAMNTAAVLASALDPPAGERVLVAPLRTGAGRTLLRLTERYAVSVFPYVDAPAGHFGQALDPGARRRLVERLAGLHAVPPPLETPAPHPALPGRSVLEAALADPRRFRTGSGPYAQSCRTLLAANGALLRATLGRFDVGTARLTSDAPASATVVTHGEPHPGNILDPGGRTLLVDWDTVALAPPERDLWLATGAPADLSRYAELTGHRPGSALLAHYGLRWALDDIAAALKVFGAPVHADTADTRQAWEGLVDAVSRLADRRA
ncbi:phosphotransferase [Streptomyces sp. NPDC091649]|uniref:phosphotransferase n=1 Tax=Streptomyces sp. NPDC091649 TaxID=3366004 RepID=UPI00380E22D6